MKNNGQAAPKKVQILKIEKLGHIFDDINDGKTISSLIAIKDEKQPLVYLVAVPAHLMPTLINGMKFLGVKSTFKEVTNDDFGDQVAQPIVGDAQ